jgi:hypothetical protein
MRPNDQASAAALQETCYIDRDGMLHRTDLQNAPSKAVGLEAIVGLCVKQGCPATIIAGPVHVVISLPPQYQDWYWCRPRALQHAEGVAQRFPLN